MPSVMYMQFVTISTGIIISVCLIFLVEMNIVQPVHVDTNPQISEAAEHHVIEVTKKVHTVIHQLKEESSVVIQLMQQLRQDITEYDRGKMQKQLSQEFQKALEQAGIATEVARVNAWCYAHSTVRDIRIRSIIRGNSIVVFYECKTVKALYYLGRMITSGVLHAAFSAIIQLLASTTVDVIVRADDFSLRLLCLSSTHSKGLYLTFCCSYTRNK